MTMPVSRGSEDRRADRSMASHVFAFSNASLNGRPDSELEASLMPVINGLHAKGYGLLPLSPSAIGLVTATGLPYHLMEDWVAAPDIISSKENAELYERQWYGAAKQGFSSDGVVWPFFDDDAMYWFWRDITYAEAFAQAFQESGGRRFTYFVNTVLRPALYYYDSDINGAYWQTLMGARAQPLTLDLQPNLDCFRPQSVQFRNMPGGGTGAPLAVLKGRIVLALNQGEIHRFLPVIRALQAQFPEQVALVMIHPVGSEVVRRLQELKIPFVIPQVASVTDKGLAHRFLNAYQTAVTASEGRPWAGPLAMLKFHFEYYCRHRWPSLALSFRAWLNLWKPHRPAAVIVSSLRDAESQLPCEAAKRFGVPTLSIPHGGSWMKTGRPGPSDYVLYQNTFQKIRGIREGIAPQRLIPCRDMLQVNEYPVETISAFPAGDRWHVLALTNEVSIGNTLSPRTVVRSQMAALAALAEVPDDMAGRIALRIKAHPHYPDLELYPAVSNGLANKVLPPNSELGTVIDETHLVIAVNYSYVAAAHALKAGLPVIFFWTDPLIFGSAEPQKNADLLLPGGVLVQTAEDLWSNVRRFFADSDFADRLRKKAGAFVQESQDDSRFLNIADVLQRVLPGHPPQTL